MNIAYPNLLTSLGPFSPLSNDGCYKRANNGNDKSQATCNCDILLIFNGINIFIISDDFDRSALRLGRDVCLVDFIRDVATAKAANRFVEVAAEPPTAMDGIWIISACDAAEIERHNVIFGKALLVPSMRTLALGIVHIPVLDALELVKQLFLGVVHVVECLAWVYPGISIFSELQEVFIGKVPVDSGTSIRFTESEAFGTRD